MKKILLLSIGLLMSIWHGFAQEYVDLGLSVNWATCNIGAKSADNPGTLFLIGTNIEFIYGKAPKKIKFSPFEKEFSGDQNLDVSTQSWGSVWRTPTLAEWQELISKCKWNPYKHTDQHGNKCSGVEVIGPNGNSIIFPYGIYQSSTPLYNYSPKINIIGITTSWVKAAPYKPSNKWGAAYRPVCNKK